MKIPGTNDGGQAGVEAQAKQPESKAEMPGFSVRLAADLGEFSLFVSGRTADVWWPDDVSTTLLQP